ncbi:PucC family protein [Rubrivivax gelatinosus]|uniref:MFS transporter n=1 Tax=Rubrivivax gelatinosus TaxID=28068 RepID=A0ABS1DVW1_RUBGE|nr:PucC family protein [Rubrivivax gelatinosus]MBK1714171.1 MFS transporter [Rubrivivax gelatinosus]
MSTIGRKFMQVWTGFGTRYLPFADAATPELPLSRLLRLSLFQISVGMAVTLLVGTLNRVMIVELGVPATIVAVMVALPLLFAPFRALIGHKSDNHYSALGWRRVPYIWKGTLLQFGGFAMMPFALLVLSGGGNSGSLPPWVGQAGAAIAFLLVGAGMHTVQTVGLALATDLAVPEARPKVVGLMYVMLLVGTIVSAFIFGWVLADFTPAKLIQVIQGAALTTMLLNVVALWKQESRNPRRGATPVESDPGFMDSWRHFVDNGDQVVRRLLTIGLGTAAFTMEDVLLEPYGGQILGLTVGDTTKLTATLALGGLFGFGLASKVLSRGMDPFRMACIGALVGIPAFFFVIIAAPMNSPFVFATGVALIGFGGGLFGHGTLTATMNLAPSNQAGLALGAWGAVQATAAGLAMAAGGILRDVVQALVTSHPWTHWISIPATGYVFVYIIELALLLGTVAAMLPLIGRSPRRVPA